ncbi:MAG: SLC13 family permease [Peptococcaceae bacterium]|nr:SLC13 family permease [Peptococcaceae bacterium]
MSEATAKKDKNLLYFVIYCIIAAMGWIIPPIDPITTEGMHLIGVFVAAIVGWSFTSEVWPSFMTLLLLPFTGLVDLNGFLAISWGSDTILFLSMHLVYVAFLDSSGTTSYVAAFLMTRKFLVGHPWRLIFMIFMMAWLLSTFCGNFAGMLIPWGFIYKICDVLGYKPFDKFANLMIFGVAVMGALSLSAVPWANNALVILNAYMATTGDQVNYLHYLSYSIPVGIFSILGFMLICKFIFRLDVSKLKNLDPNVFNSKDLKLTVDNKIALISLLVLIIVLVVPSLLPAENIIRVVSNNLGLGLKAALIFLVLGLIRIDGRQVFKFGELATKGVPWNMVMMTAGILSFVSLLGSDATGISAFLGKMLTPLFNDSSVIFFFLLTLVITVFLTNFMINMVVAVIMISATLPIAASLGVDSLQIVYLITVSCTIAFMLPAASAASCVLFANTQWVRAKDVYKYSVPTIIMMALIALVWNFILFLF